MHVGCRQHGEGHFNAPVYGNGKFWYVPIPEGKDATERSWTYAELGLEDVLPKPWRFGEYAHYDPEFPDFTYGEPDTRKHGLRLRIPRQLHKNDFLFFISSLTYRHREDVERHPDIVNGWAYYFIGFFELEEDPIRVPSPFPQDVVRRFSNNAHIRRKETDDPLLLFRGTSVGKKRSRLLQRAIALSNGTTPNDLATHAMPWLKPRRNMGPTGWRYRWWSGDFVGDNGVTLLLSGLGVDP